MMLDDALFAASRCNGLRGGDGITDGTPRHPVVSVERNDLRFALCLWPAACLCRWRWRGKALTLAVGAVSLDAKGYRFFVCWPLNVYLCKVANKR